MTLDLEQRKRALAHLGITWTHRGDEFEVHGEEPSDAELEDAYAEWEAAEQERAEAPTAQDLLDAIRELADEGAEVESRIHERASQKAQERAQA